VAEADTVEAAAADIAAAAAEADIVEEAAVVVDFAEAVDCSCHVSFF